MTETTRTKDHIRDTMFYGSHRRQAPKCQTTKATRKSCGLKSGVLKNKKKGKSETLGIRFREGELGIIRIKALQAGCTTNTYIRASALGSEYKQPRDPELLKALHIANRELTMQGVNLNQIARQLNSGQARLDEAEGMIGQIARSMFHAHKAVRHAITQGKMWPEDEV